MECWWMICGGVLMDDLWSSVDGWSVVECWWMICGGVMMDDLWLSVDGWSVVECWWMISGRVLMDDLWWSDDGWSVVECWGMIRGVVLMDDPWGSVDGWSMVKWLFMIHGGVLMDDPWWSVDGWSVVICWWTPSINPLSFFTQHSINRQWTVHRRAQCLFLALGALLWPGVNFKAHCWNFRRRVKSFRRTASNTCSTYSKKSDSGFILQYAAIWAYFSSIEHNEKK